ncbi:MAG: potassium channel family protein [Gammaproteobacteria bacterium]|nr:potassium channel family protein [Gammaproteobacteria bacterium]MBU1479703.1 potassium channel family protein [Gammaproteobacteria bacterium]MBU1999719.1 potassium channel family protein [Gammaproteobacteria bacterium]MBU2133098.1 potassium channel family protein [Gammaproteobacteria bacterium]MBU2185474.1 potassium channel family protein [Gammaproteobacteria bacterium]
MSINSTSVKKLVIAYFVCIIFFALIYFFCSPEELCNFNKELSPVSALYFSVVTITTLGYGDILPTSELMQVVISIQALLGIIILGMLINAAWSNYAEKVEKKTEAALKYQAQLENDRKLKAYSNAISWVFNNMRHSFFEVTTPVVNREGASLELNQDFKEKDLVGMFDISLKYKNGFTTSIEAFYNNEDELVGELKFILANFDLDHHQSLQKSIVDYIGLYFSDQSRGALLLHSANCPNGKDIKTIRQCLESHKDGDQFKEGFSSTILNPIFIFSLMVKTKYKHLTSIRDELQSISLKVT